jgi:glycosyltransferase involved in cell wall biosynthesis
MRKRTSRFSLLYFGNATSNNFKAQLHSKILWGITNKSSFQNILAFKKLLNIFLSFSPYSVYNKNRDAYKSEYRKYKIVVVPIYYGSGTNIKVLEAMSMKRASVITDFVARGFKKDLIDNQYILIAKENQDFANKVIQLLFDNRFKQVYCMQPGMFMQ